MKHKLYILITFFLILSGMYFFYNIYEEVKHKTVSQLNQQQKILAKRAASSIQAFFKSYELNLKFLAKIESIKKYSGNYRTYMKKFYNSHSENVKAVTRIDENGNIVYTYPENKKVIGKNVLSQEHNTYIYEKHLPVISDVFNALQGYRAIAYAYPVFNKRGYAGCITILLSFTTISKKYVESIKIRKSGYAWMISKKGIELYCPVPGHTGKTVLETSGQYPSIMEMAKHMKAGEEGKTVYYYNKIKGKDVEQVKKYAVYYPIRIANTHWSIVIATLEDEVTGLMKGFVNKLIIIFLIIFISGMAVVFYGYNSVALGREVKQRKDTEKKLLAVKIYLDNIFNSMPDILIGMDDYGNIENMNHRAEDFSSVSIDQAIGKNVLNIFPQFSDELSLIISNKDGNVSVGKKIVSKLRVN